MADVKISGLPASTTPLAGTEVLPIVQSGVTKKVSIANVTAGRTVSANVLLAGTTTILNYGGNSTLAKQQVVLSYSNTNAVLPVAAFVTRSTGTPANGIGAQIDLCADNAYGSISPYGSVGCVGTNLNNISGALYFSTMLNNSSTEKMRISAAGDATLNVGNLVIGTSGKGIDFSATPGTGTSELLNDYEEGTWTPTGNNITYTAASGYYVKVGALVTIYYSVTFPVTVDVNQARLGGLPYVSSNTTLEVAGGVANLVTLVDGNTYGRFLPIDLTLYTANNTLSGLTIIGQISYKV